MSFALPEPDVPEGFALEQVGVTRSEGNVSVSVQYANETTSLSVMKLDNLIPIFSMAVTTTAGTQAAR